MEYSGLTLREHEGKFYFEDLELEGQHEGRKPNQKIREVFLQRYSLSESSASSPSVNHLLKNRVGLKRSLGGYSNKRLEDEKREYPDALGWFDHTELLYHKQSKSYVLVTQPYNLKLEDFQALEQFCQERGLACRIDYHEAWWYPGRTPLVAVCPSASMSAIFGA